MKVLDLIENELIHDTEKIENLSNLSFFQSWIKVLNWVKWATCMKYRSYVYYVR